ncbi:protein of unknown function DUF624 [Caldalkalibacillus thermarum TA2.A1]|uniref:YesL family protein n=1 Tax=Caldalkalibacillus thermarum (strain TA2.A1) TaxID=986075 RepID=F5LAU1_CALTT|nr:YesL family protein [Caldalkalibacillus thermarum]EGL81480.1 protein of unknown function DUF624 [Caldalkalibacillus thermarum TA2.A1]QZT33786.1 YesL family protein [Caldalkalibacillus thermarum TA2.A1]
MIARGTVCRKSANSERNGGMIEMRGITGGIYAVCEWIMRLAYLNILWIVFTLLGGIILGIAPATTAMFTITRKWVRGEYYISLFSAFIDAYKKEFKNANLLFLILLSTGMILTIDLWFFKTMDGGVNPLLYYLTIFLLINYSIMTLYVFPVFVHYDLKLLQYFKHAWIIGIASPVQTALMGVCLVVMCLAIMLKPVIFPFMSVAPLSWVMMKLAYRTFKNIENRA